jgi:hypothetical protein
MTERRKQRPFPIRRLWIVLLGISIAGSWSCGSSASGTAGPTPTPTPTPTATPPVAPTLIELKVLDTSVPPGGIFQFQLSNTEAKPIGHGSTRPQVPLGPVRGVAVNDPSGLAAGIAVVNGSNIAIQLNSPDALLGTNVSYPIVTMSMPLVDTPQQTFAPGQTFPISSTGSIFADGSNQNYPTVTVASGTLTVAAAGSPYVSDVAPAGGLLPDRQLVKIFGSGFNKDTRVSIEGTTIVPADVTFVNSGEIDVRICNGTVAETATVCPGNGGTFQLDGERVRVKDQTSNFVLEYYTYLRADDIPGSNNDLVKLVHPMFSRQTYLSATTPLVNTATQFTGLSLQNTNALDSVIKIELLDASNLPLANTTFTLPGLSGGIVGKKISRDVVSDWFPSPPAGATTVRVTVTSGPAVQVLGMLGNKNDGTVAPVIPKKP